MRILVINSGSSSIKFVLYQMEMENATRLLSGLIERIGQTNCTTLFRQHSSTGEISEQPSTCPSIDHAAGLNTIMDYLQSKLGSLNSIDAIGHRVVHGGETFKSPTLITDDVIAGISTMIPLAPLHNPANLAGIQAMISRCPQIPNVAIFDTAFFHTLPQYAYRYALPDELCQSHHLRRFGFHGISHQHVAQTAADILEQPLDTLRIISLHLGNGASAAAIHHGNCIDTSMGMTPLEGLIMGTRGGDIDPGVLLYLIKQNNMSSDDVDTLLNQHSGLKGICGVNDMRDIHNLANEGNKQARLAIDMFCYRICKYIGAYAVALGGLDALVFTAGIGENDPNIRYTICSRLSMLGIALDKTQNETQNGNREINSPDSLVKVLVIAGDEELEIARQTVRLIVRNT